MARVRTSTGGRPWPLRPTPVSCFLLLLARNRLRALPHAGKRHKRFRQQRDASRADQAHVFVRTAASALRAEGLP